MCGNVPRCRQYRTLNNTLAELNKGEARNALARAVFFNRLRELRDRTFETSDTAPTAST